jgi:PAS domain S-box-containing protein
VAAEETRAQLAALVESAEDAIVSSSLEGMIISWNSGAEQLYGYRAEEIVGQPAMLLGSNLSSEPEREERLAAARAGHPVAPFETVRRRRDGTTFAASIALSSIRDRNGAVIGLSSITRDITERNRADAELRAALEAAQAATRTKSLFLAMMSHELRTPLQAILGYADFLLADTGVPLTSQQVEDVQSIHRGALRMVELIEQMLDLSRMEAGRLELETKAVHLAEILEQVRQDVAPQCEAKRLRLTITVPAALPAALGDPVRLRQILLNLVGNAVKFTEEGAVEVAATATAAGLSVSVRDTGIGIAAEALPHIFEEFRQVDGNLTRRYGGAGLGLAIAKRLAEQMSGGITVESTPDAGSTFTLTVPAAG